VTEVLLADNRPRWALRPYRRIRERSIEVRMLGARIAEGVKDRKPKEAARLWLELADELVRVGRVEEAVGYVVRGRDALLAANHPVLARRHVKSFVGRHRGEPQVMAELERVIGLI
jgi:hypothetical protein